MIRKKIDDINIEDLKNLVENNIQEKKTLEYKAELPDNSDNGKKEFLADISSLANTDGGDLIFGICEKSGALQDKIGLQITNIDGEIARLENIARDGVSPRVCLEIKTIDIENYKKAIVLRVKASLNSPHRVIFKGHDKFYKRNTNGKYALDVDELRNAFIQSSELIDRIRRFRTARISDIKVADTPFPISDNSSFIAIHVLPLTSFTTSFQIPSLTLLALKEAKYSSLFSPFYESGWNHRINLDGVVAYSSYNGKQAVKTYTQLYRDGKIEAVESDILSRRGSEEQKVLPMYSIESETMQYVSKMSQLLNSLEFQPPYYAYLSLIGIKGFTVSAPRGHHFLETELINQNDLILPEVIIESLDDNLEHKFKPIFDMIWNAGGVSRSLNFDDNNNFKNQP